LRSWVAALSNRLLSGVRNRCESLRILLLSIFCLIVIGQSWILLAAGSFGVAFQPAHCSVSLKDLTAASMSASVLSSNPNLYVYCLNLVVFLDSAHVMLVLQRPGNDRRIDRDMIVLQRSLEE
jgi:hypothetical protein